MLPPFFQQCIFSLSSRLFLFKHREFFLIAKSDNYYKIDSVILFLREGVMFLKFRYLFVFSAVFIFAAACASNKHSSNNDESNIDSDTDSDVAVIADTDKIEDTDTTDEDITDTGNDEAVDEDADSIEPVFGVTGHLWVESGSLENKSIHFYECGVKPNDDQFVKTDADGYFEVETVLESGKAYCVESDLSGSCFFASSVSHIANINPMTNLAFSVSQSIGSCADLRDTETAIRKYLKVATGTWLGELDYEALPGIQAGFETVKGLKEKAKTSDILDDIIADIQKTENREFESLFNGFVVIPEKNEVIIEDTTEPVAINIAGGSDTTAPDFEIVWQIINEKPVGAKSEIWSDDPGEFAVKAFLYEKGEDVYISQSASAVTFFAVESDGVIDVSDLSADSSYWVSDGAVAIFAAGTVITKDSSPVTEIGYKLLSGGGSQIAKVAFTPSGTVFTNDPMFFIVDLGMVFSGDPIMLGVERTDSSGNISVLNQASGDPIMLTASGDPIMFTASGDPIMNIASGDPIMMGDMSSVLVTTTSHFSDFAVKRRQIPVKTSGLLDNWQTTNYPNGSPYMFIAESITKYKGTGADEFSRLFADRISIEPIEGDVDRLFNMTVGNVKNADIFENYFFIDSMIKRLKERKAGTENERYAAVYKGFDIKNIIYELFIEQMTHERAVTVAGLFDKALIPETFSMIDVAEFPDIKSLASNALLKMPAADLKRYHIVSKRDALDLLNFVPLSGGPTFGVLNGLLTPDEVLCVWLTNKNLSTCKLTPSSFAINNNGNVEIDGTEVTGTDIDVAFSIKLKELPAVMSLKKKHNLFRTLYLIINYAANLYENGPAVTQLSDGIKKMVFEMFDGMDSGQNAIKLVDSVDNSFNTVSVIKENRPFEVPIFENITDLLNQVNVVVPSGLLETDVINSISVKINGYGYIMNTTGGSDLRPGYETDSSMGIKTFTVNDLNYSGFSMTEGEQKFETLANIFSEQDLNVFGNCIADVSVVLISTVDGKKYTRTKNYMISIGSIENAESYAGTIQSRQSTGEIQVSIYNEVGQILDIKNGGVVLMPGNIVLNNNGTTNMVFSNLKPAVYVLEGFAEGYYPVRKTVVLNKGDMEFVTLQLMALQTGTETGTVQIGFNKRIAGGGTDVLTSSDLLTVLIVDQDSNIVKEYKNHAGSDNLSVPDLKYGQYSIKVVSDKFYTALQSLSVTQTSFEVFITLETKNICGNKIVEPGEECDNGYKTSNTNLKCEDVYSDALYPENTLYCNYSCTYNSDSCYTISK